MKANRSDFLAKGCEDKVGANAPSNIFLLKQKYNCARNLDIFLKYKAEPAAVRRRGSNR